MNGSILQPTYLPWLGYFEMIASVDIFVIYDHVQFVKKSWHHRNYIKGPNGAILLSLPVKKSPLNTVLCDVEFASLYKKNLSDHWLSISHAYKKASYFDIYCQELHFLFSRNYLSLTELTTTFIKFFCKHLEISTRFITSSTLMLDESIENSSLKIVEICRKAGITNLYDASGAQKIIDTEIFYSSNIKIQFQQYDHPIYRQQFGKFIPYMSILDLMLNEGPSSLEVIKSGRRPPLVI